MGHGGCGSSGYARRRPGAMSRRHRAGGLEPVNTHPIDVLLPPEPEQGGRRAARPFRADRALSSAERRARANLPRAPAQIVP
jgi:hypothetical protein